MIEIAWRKDRLDAWKRKKFKDQKAADAWVDRQRKKYDNGFEIMTRSA